VPSDTGASCSTFAAAASFKALSLEHGGGRRDLDDDDMGTGQEGIVRMESVANANVNPLVRISCSSEPSEVTRICG